MTSLWMGKCCCVVVHRTRFHVFECEVQLRLTIFFPILLVLWTVDLLHHHFIIQFLYLQFETESVFPFSFLHIRPMRCRYEYAVHRDDLEGTDTIMHAMHGWLGSMTVCCTPMVRFGKWQVEFHRPGAGDPELNIDQSKNLLEVERGNDLLAALCIAYAFDKALCQPLVTIIGYEEKEHLDDDDDSLDSFDPEDYGAAAAGAPRGIDAPPPDDDAYREYDEPPQVDGYLEAPPAYHDDEPDGYLQDNAYDDSYSQPPASGYLDSGAYDEGYEEPAGYIDSGEGYDENAGYIDDGGGYDYGDSSQQDGNLIDGYGDGYEYDSTTYDGTIDSGYDARKEGMHELD